MLLWVESVCHFPTHRLTSALSVLVDGVRRLNDAPRNAVHGVLLTNRPSVTWKVCLEGVAAEVGRPSRRIRGGCGLRCALALPKRLPKPAVGVSWDWTGTPACFHGRLPHPPSSCAAV
uniref:Secreted protein n=1 Tax=Mesocestoides corti TaxID=53468 RepID=A0A5K3FJL7_MESCO